MGLADLQAAKEEARGQRREKARLDARLPVGAQITGGEGYVTVETETPVNDGQWDWVLDHHPALSREHHEVDETVLPEFGSWQTKAADQEPIDLFRYKVKVRTKRPGERLAAPAVERLRKLVAKRKPVTPITRTEGTWLVFCMSDLQLGSSDYEGTPEVSARVATAIDAFVVLAKEVKPVGITIVDMGDAIEGVAGCYPDQAASVDMNLTEQIDLALVTFLAAINAALTLAPKILFVAVPSNHGELRFAGNKSVTDKARDNVDLMLAKSIGHVLAANPDQYGHVEVWTPPTEGGDPFVCTLDLGGVMVGFSHGHQVNVGKTRMRLLEEWWERHRWTDRQRRQHDVLPTAADCDIMVVGHGHTFMMSQMTGKLMIQCPAADSGSEYFTTGTGVRSSAGLLTFEVSSAWPMFANNWRIL